MDTSNLQQYLSNTCIGDFVALYARANFITNESCVISIKSDKNGQIQDAEMKDCPDTSMDITVKCYEQL